MSGKSYEHRIVQPEKFDGPSDLTAIYVSFLNYEELKMQMDRLPVDERIRITAQGWLGKNEAMLIFSNGLVESVKFEDVV